MNPEITPEQNGQLTTWAGQRDAILLEISNLRTEKDKLEVANKKLADSNTEIQVQINMAIGRLAELDKVEEDYNNIVSSSLTENLIAKTRLESEVTNLKKIIAILAPQKEELEKDLKSLSDIFYTMNDRVGVLDKVVDHVTRVSEQNSNSIESTISNLKSSIQKIIDANNENVASTNLVLDKLPKMLIELQRVNLIRNKI